MRMFSVSTLVVLALIAGCAGRAANPTMVQQYGDDRKSCQAIEQELKTIQGEIQVLVPQTEKTGKNAALGVAGFFLIVPLFFMDFSQAEQTEINAYRQRYNHLLALATDKNCGLPGEQIPAFVKR